MRPIDPSKHFQGDLCEVCGTTLRYKRGLRCVECTRRQNARKYKGDAAPLDPTKPRPIVSRASVGVSLSHYASSVTARERSARLDMLIHGENPDEAKTICGGDLHRASLPVGFTPKPSGYEQKIEAQHAENDVLRAAIRDVWSRLPNIVTIPDVMAAVPPAVVEPINPTRWPITVSAILVELGATPVPKTMGMRRYVVRGAMPAPQRRRGKRGPDKKPWERPAAAAAAANQDSAERQTRMVNGSSRRAPEYRAGRPTHGRPSAGQKDQRENETPHFGQAGRRRYG